VAKSLPEIAFASGQFEREMMLERHVMWSSRIATAYRELVPYSTISPPQALFMVGFHNPAKALDCCCSDHRQH